MRYCNRSVPEPTSAATPAFRKTRAHPPRTARRASDPSEIDFLDLVNIGAQPWHDFQHAERQLDEQPAEHNANQHRSVENRRPAFHKHEIKHRRNDQDRRRSELAPELKSRADQLPESVTILPDPTANGDQANADSDICEHVDRALHRVRDREKRILALLKPSHEENSARKPDQLHEHLDRGEADDMARKPQGVQLSRRLRSDPTGIWRGIHDAKIRLTTRPAPSGQLPAPRPGDPVLSLPGAETCRARPRHQVYYNTQRIGSSNTPAAKYRHS